MLQAKAVELAAIERPGIRGLVVCVWVQDTKAWLCVVVQDTRLRLCMCASRCPPRWAACRTSRGVMRSAIEAELSGARHAYTSAVEAAQVKWKQQTTVQQASIVALNGQVRPGLRPGSSARTSTCMHAQSD